MLMMGRLGKGTKRSYPRFSVVWAMHIFLDNRARQWVGMVSVRVSR